MIEINIFSSFLIVFLFIILFFRKNNALPNRILALALLTPAFNFMDNVSILTGTIYSFPWGYFIVQLTAALFAPLSYHYILLMTGEKNPKEYKWLKLASLFIMLTAVYFAFNFAGLNVDGQKAYLDGVKYGPYPEDMMFYSFVLFLHQLLYFTFNIIQVRRFKKKSMDHLSNLTSAKVVYLYRFVAILWILTLITVVLYATIDTVYVEYINLPLVLVIIILFIVYSAFHQHAVFSEKEYQQHLEIVTTSENFEEASAPNTTATDKESDELFTRIYAFIAHEDFYKDQEASMEKLSASLGIPSYKLNKSIKNSGTTFYELIRKIRVQKAKELLEDENRPYTIEGIAYEVGFNSRAAFYRAFQKYEQKEPSSIHKGNDDAI